MVVVRMASGAGRGGDGGADRGRVSGGPRLAEAGAAAGGDSDGGVRERVLLVAVGDHLERSQMVLVELANAGAPAAGRLDISYEQKTAEDLLESNRLYRQTAATNGDVATAALLEELERVLLEIAHSPSEVSARQLEELRKQIEDRGILFKVKIFGSQVEQSAAKHNNSVTGKKGTKHETIS